MLRPACKKNEVVTSKGGVTISQYRCSPHITNAISDDNKQATTTSYEFSTEQDVWLHFKSQRAEYTENLATEY
eukprot:10713066-Ditylum_brightwellii.AAC.1